MIREAGGKATDQFGKKIKMKGDEKDTIVIASKGKIHDQILEIIGNTE